MISKILFPLTLSFLIEQNIFFPGTCSSVGTINYFSQGVIITYYVYVIGYDKELKLRSIYLATL